MTGNERPPGEDTRRKRATQRGCQDARRERVLSAAGYRVLHVTAEEVLESVPSVVARIAR